MTMATIAEAAEVLNVSRRHIEKLIEEADTYKKSRWRWGKELIELTPVSSTKRTIRVDLSKILTGPYGSKDCLAFERLQKGRCHKAVSKAVTTGQMPAAKELQCTRCANPAKDYHHEDYTKPLNVEPLCRSCHSIEHFGVLLDS